MAGLAERVRGYLRDQSAGGSQAERYSVDHRAEFLVHALRRLEKCEISPEFGFRISEVANDHEEGSVVAVGRTYRATRALVPFTRTGILVRSALAAAIPLHTSQEFHERPQRDRLLQRRVSLVLPVQPGR